MEEVLSVDERFAIVTAGQRTSGPLRVLKQGEAFGVFDQYGDIVPGGELGLYYKGTRYLSGLELLLARHRPLLLSSTVSDDNAVFVADYTNLDVGEGGRIELPHGAIHLLRSRILGNGFSIDRVRVSNHSLRTVEIPIAVRFQADFADVFEVRGTPRAAHGSRLPDRVLSDHCVLGYRGLDQVERRTCIRWSRRPDALEPGLASFLFRLEPHAPVVFDMRVICEDGAAPVHEIPTDYGAALATARSTLAGRTERSCRVRTSHESLNRWLKRSTADLQMMLTDTGHGLYPYAGIPWFSTPFGRDGLVTAFELLWAAPEVARGVLTFLAATQAAGYSDVQDAEPGKILHEMRNGEMAALGEVPFGRYYGSIDSTPLFVLLACAYFERTADRDLIDRLWPNLLAALRWMEADGDADGDGFIEYARHSENGLVQQGWRDSNDSVFHADGTLAAAPIALCEVQGYAYAAWRGAARLAELRGEDEKACQWQERADRLRQRFDEAFWCEELGTYAMALDGEKRPCRVRTSAPAHCLLTGLVSPGPRADRLTATLMDEPSFAGWGVRTVAAGQARYNPMSYHNGSIWPHDNALVAAGLARAGHTDPAMRIFGAMLDLSQSVDLHRLPELICGFHRRFEERPTLYPVACAPQAWAAGAVYLLIQASLGLEIDAAARRITFNRAMIPESVERVYLNNLAVADAEVDLLLERHAHDVGVSVLRRQGRVEIVTIK
jgi:glycogen debranching enzyme